jgi:hypothetical protein
MSAPINLTFGEAVKLLPEGDSIHTFRNPRGGMILGADWDRASLLEAMRESSHIQVTGAMAQSMGHGLAINADGVLFIEAANYDKAAAPTGQVAAPTNEGEPS